MRPELKDCQERLQTVLNFCREKLTTDLYSKQLSYDSKHVITEFKNFPLTSVADFIKYEPLSLALKPEKDVRYTISTFMPEQANFVAFPLGRNEIWQTASNVCQTFKPKSVMIVIPSLWQLAPILYHTVKSQDIPLLHVTPSNPPLIEQAIAETESSVICTTADILHSLIAKFTDSSVLDRVKAWIIVSPVNRFDFSLNVTGKVFIDYQVFPGVSVAAAEFDTKMQTLSEISYSSDYYLEFDGTDQIKTVTNLNCVPLPLLRFHVN